jgi:hypothetical protein
LYAGISRNKTASNALFGSFPVKNYPKDPFRGSLRVNLQACCCHPNN